MLLLYVCYVCRCYSKKKNPVGDNFSLTWMLMLTVSEFVYPSFSRDEFPDLSVSSNIALTADSFERAQHHQRGPVLPLLFSRRGRGMTHPLTFRGASIFSRDSINSLKLLMVPSL